jgi:hypothetical protein
VTDTASEEQLGYYRIKSGERCALDMSGNSISSSDALRYINRWIGMHMTPGGRKPLDYSGFRKLAGGEIRQRTR